ncbi:hypothetical protein KVA01_09020 [Kocuria varians]|uniref:Uncharacterized protein n=1 Tax=Kocuria varians TaxID=1272 RepID=A0A4Y4D643_KOCVA|nr:hypothetical protein KVA01_09020 [Kocuria varians]
MTVQHGHVRGLPQLPDQPLQHGLRGRAQLQPGRVAEPDQPGTERVAAVGQLAHVSQRDQRAQQPVDGGQGQLGPGGELTEGGLAAGRGDDAEQVEDPLHGLHPARALAVSHACALSTCSLDVDALPRTGCPLENGVTAAVPVARVRLGSVV